MVASYQEVAGAVHRNQTSLTKAPQSPGPSVVALSVLKKAPIPEMGCAFEQSSAPWAAASPVRQTAAKADSKGVRMICMVVIVRKDASLREDRSRAARAHSRDRRGDAAPFEAEAAADRSALCSSCMLRFMAVE